MPIVYPQVAEVRNAWDSTDIIQRSPQMHVSLTSDKTKDKNSAVFIVNSHAYKKFPALKES
jgi:hypothetical protein